MDDKRLSYLLETWRDWLNEPAMHLGYPSTAAGIRWRSADDWEDLVDHLDETMARAVDTAVDDLPLPERTSVYSVVVRPAVWRLREPMHVVYERARGLLKVQLRARGIE
jgi:hypothetical protein